RAAGVPTRSTSWSRRTPGDCRSSASGATRTRWADGSGRPVAGRTSAGGGPTLLVIRTPVRQTERMTSLGALRTASAVLEHARDLTDIEWDQAPGKDALEAAVVLTRARALIDVALVGLTDRLESTGVPAAVGWASTKDLLTHLLGGRKGAGAA